MSWYSVEYLLVFIVFTSFGLIRDAHGHFCPKDWIYRQDSNSCYLITTMVRRPWLEAQLACEANEGYLLKIDDEDERNWILTQIGKVQSTDTLRTSEWWLGLNDRKKELKWVWTDGTPIAEKAIVWNDHEPNNWGGTEWCAEIWGHGLNDKSCSIVQAYICERPKNYPFKCDNDRGWEYYNGTCYKFFSEPMSWHNAQFTCEMEDSELITIEDRTVQFHVNDLAMKYLKSVWIGLRYIEDEDKGAYEWQWTNGKQVSINFWNEGRFPFIKEQVKNNTCAFADPYIKTVNIWLSGECHSLKPFMCQKKTGTCVDGWEQHQDSCYQFSFLYRLTYTKAKEYCEAQNAYLADINSARDQDFINDKLKELSDAGIERFWIGLTVDMEGRPEWDNGENVTFTNWPLNGKPRKTHNARCVHIKTNNVEGRWVVDNACSQARAFVCKIATDVKVKDVAKPVEHYSCAPGWFAMSKYCYKFFSASLTWLAAKIACQKHNAHLIKVSGRTAMSVLKIPTRFRKKYVWIGLNDRAKEGNMIWESDGTKLDPTFARWYPGEPDNVESHENCVASSLLPVAGYWSDFDCQRSFPFVCQRLADNIPEAENTTLTPGVNQACGAEWESDPTGKTCYHFSDEQLTWFDAQLSCSYHGGYLASITGLHEQFYIAGRIQNMQSVTLWIGAHDLQEEGLWLWSDKSPMSYFNWKTGHPDYDRVKNNCAMVGRNDSLWVDNVCYLRSGYICKKAALPEPTTTLTPPTPPPDDSEFSCPNTWVFYDGACYKVVTELFSWEHSLQNCYLQGGDLVSINSRSEQSFIHKLVTTAKPSKIFWIGLTDAHHEGIYTWSNGDKVMYTNWNAWEPNNFVTENCVLYSTSEKRWSDYKCNSKEGSICKKAAERIATENCLSNIQSGSLCFMHVMIPKNWHDAWTYCRSKFNGDLATIDNYKKQQSANQGILSHGPPYWIAPESSKGPFQNWKDDKKVELTNSKCLAIESGSMKKWIRISCLDAAYFICARSLDATKNTTLSPPVISPSHSTTTIETTPVLPSVETNVTLSCPEEWKFFRNSCYKEFYTNLHGLKWIDALHSCQEHSALLVSLESDEELMFLRTNVMKKNNNPYWLGGRFTESGNITWLNSKYPVNVDHGLIPFSFHSLCPVISQWQPNIYSLHCDQAADWICKMTPRFHKEEVNTENLDIYCKRGSLLQGPYFNGSCYVSAFEFKKVTWHKSKTVCELYNKRIASIHSQDENDFLAMAFSARRFFWIGIHTYSMVHDNKWADGSEIDYTNWDEGEPSDIYKNPCTILDTMSGKWRTINCYALIPALCKGQDNHEISDKHHETVLTGGCPPGFALFGNKCFKIEGTGYREQLGWQAAQEKCHSYGKLFGLASIQTRFEQAFLTLMMKSLNISLWIGMRKGLDYLTWVDNSPLSFFHFSTLAVEELLQYTGTSCIATHTEPYSAGLWFGSNCYELAGYICQGYRDANLPLVKKPEVVSKLGYKKYGNAEYKVVKMNKTWTEAEAFCQKDGGAHVASIADAFENAALRLMGKDVQEEFWIGARKRGKQMAWSDSWPMQYTRWPVIMTEEDECGLYQAQDVWNMVDCNKEYPFICKITYGKPPKVAGTPSQTGKCPEDWIQIKNKCYLVKSTLRSWPDANYVCAQIGATLTSLHSADDITSIKDVRISLALLPSNSIWIGLSLKSGILHWSDDSNVDFLNFMHGETSDDDHASYFNEHNISRNCFVMDFQTALWRRVSCFEKFTFLCMTDQLLPPTTNSSGVCLNCTTGIPEPVKPTVTTVEIVAICLVVPVLLVVLALIPYYIIKRKTEAASPETESFLNSLYESPNFMVMNPC
ncbi:C-type mannose receptor 2-like isoform X2 [Octopus sinensis]|uniref:C-type mannose receptor 2-like isoform X2 n=1 Tax=Octopus sinensis TaxID=2607531 RepID=A0A6P7SHX0_9MOLL|nr:C-type mannose receptor 2-like isoform X2 [Octopus sinensis]